MLKVELKGLLDRLKVEIDYTPTLTELSKETGIHRTIISQLANSPAQKVSTVHIDKLLQFAFKRLRTSYGKVINRLNPNWDLSDEELMNSLVGTLIKSYPDAPEFWKDVDQYFTSQELEFPETIPTKRLWQFHTMAHHNPNDEIHTILREKEEDTK